MRKILCWSSLSIFAQAEWSELTWPQLNATLPVWKPETFDDSKTYPAIIFYHGTNGRPTASLMHQVTEGKSFILIGMTYSEQGRMSYTDQLIRNELGLLAAVKKTLIKSFSVDPRRIYVAGFSKGGWHSSMLLDYDRDLAGGLILGGGLFEKRAELERFKRPKPVYIGSGRYDGNYPPSIGAFVYFRKLGADATLEAWPDTGHDYPKKVPEAMRQWLRVQANENDLESEASDWIADRVQIIEGMQEPVDRFFALEEFITLPFVKTYGKTHATMAQKRIDELLLDPAVAAERKWRNASRRILLKESGDRLVSTLQQASRAHLELSENAPETRAGKEAKYDYERTRKLIETAKVVQRPIDDTTNTVTPEPSKISPSGTLFTPPKIR